MLCMAQSEETGSRRQRFKNRVVLQTGPVRHKDGPRTSKPLIVPSYEGVSASVIRENNFYISIDIKMSLALTDYGCSNSQTSAIFINQPFVGANS